MGLKRAPGTLPRATLRERLAGIHGQPPLLERVRIAAHLVSRLATSRLRALPDFLILGAARCGTTSLYVDLREHPRVRRALRKEVFFFDHTYHRGAAWYRAFFPLRRSLAPTGGSEGRLRTGEATPCYLFHPHAPRRVAETVPDARLIVLLRNPVDRAYSYYQQSVRFGVEPESFEEAVRLEAARLDDEEARALADGRYFSVSRQYRSYLARGHYAEQLERWFARFPREQMLVLFSESVWRDPPSAFRAVTDFLGLSPWQPPFPAHRKEARYPPMEQATRQRLDEYFAPHDDRLAALLGAELPWRG